MLPLTYFFGKVKFCCLCIWIGKTYKVFQWEKACSLFYGKVPFGILCVFIRKTVRKSFYDNKNMANDRSDKWLMLYKMFDPRGLCVLVPGLYVIGLLSNIFSKTICASHITCWAPIGRGNQWLFWVSNCRWAFTGPMVLWLLKLAHCLISPNAILWTSI